MRTITKRAEPASLTRHRSTQQADWAGYRDVADARKALCVEQGFICAFCTNRIRPVEPVADKDHGTKVAHWHPRKGPNGSPDLQLRWTNLLGCCPGGESGAPRHCDTAQADALLRIHPVLGQPSPELAIRCQRNGLLYSGDPAIQRDIDETLNLNCEKLRQKREAVIDGAFPGLAKGKHWSVAELRARRNAWTTLDADGMFMPFSQFAVARIDQRIARHSAKG